MLCAIDKDIDQGRRVLRTEVCVVGSGAGGSVAAATLAEAGVSTLLLEEGDYHRADTMTQNELEMMPRLFQDAGQRTTDDQGVLLLQGRALGGGTTHNTGICVPVSAARWHEWRQQGATPCSYEEFSPYLDRVMTTIGARRAEEGEINANNAILRRGAERLGLSHSIVHHNRASCSGCGYCTLGCAYNRKHSVVHAFLPGGVAAGLQIRTGAEVESLRYQDGGWRLTGSSAAGARFEVECDQLVLAAGAIHTPLLLQRAKVARRRRPGHGLRLHPAVSVGARFADDVILWRGVPQTVVVDGGDDHLLVAAPVQPAGAAALTPQFGEKLRQELLGLPRMAAATVLLHDHTTGVVRSRLGRRVSIRYWPDARDRERLRDGIQLLARLFLAAGAEEVQLPYHGSSPVSAERDLEQSRPRLEPHRLKVLSVHPQSTCAMGEDAGGAVCSVNGAVHGTSGLFIADASLFPSSVGIPPQVTIMALAMRVAEGVIEGRKKMTGSRPQ